jgi:hypothetical protein
MDVQTLQDVGRYGHFTAGIVVEHAGTSGRDHDLLDLLYQGEGIPHVFNGHLCPHFDCLTDEPVVQDVGVQSALKQDPLGSVGTSERTATAVVG